MSTHSDSQDPTLVTPSLLRDWPLPAPGEDKYSRGAVLVIGGARATPGAALLAGTSALRAGAGKITLAVAESVAVPVGVALPECGSVGLPETPEGSVTGEGLNRISSYLDRADAVLIGPGLDHPDLAESLLRALLEREKSLDTTDDGGAPAIVLDAFALGGLVEIQDDLGPWRGRLILTPNPTEAGILLGRDVKDLGADVAEIARRFDAVVSCQGYISGPSADDPTESALWKITTGYGGLGTSGSGDVLAGAIAGLRARGTSDAQAACWGTHLHAAAADRLASKLGPLGFLARELADQLPALMLELNT
ncbi:NAD(P)H-hydrate dehydratase [Paenarthrobacter aurescens]|uniref:ADP-dependent (S)-NAD(P)H-hydrate dehydratase n=1 Tax=Paenarthrobacter aurescens TaxID=43663 RepID=A0A4Y3NGA8_PAEAU|nr:NAD(P)H-hydrate dehydratase [Paenarthrobacter aurescens]MDO6142520.1 NAD(P)H-hydrate dehydratase [Paenarthrobacter aurescens]MDO6146367.1 NAD(P)H-hydrate dehydratase [Paenarthrobacter aurescens]MDO6157612.1 NAD(P)H-hydrate dehydratase [Paenarthrobacter aurescens]MDO6161597.1 NAD(P)H-hydrate dehydratase [Paenarthrobacter aurescens]GEB20722.1 ADP-dependent (S)-NAD(P)H-hydrate dehydratase [Paenarthrobacter aurescens]